MKPTKIALIGISLFFIVVCGTAFAAMIIMGNYIVAAIELIAVVLNAITIVMLISEK